MFARKRYAKIKTVSQDGLCSAVCSAALADVIFSGALSTQKP